MATPDEVREALRRRRAARATGSPPASAPGAAPVQQRDADAPPVADAARALRLKEMLSSRKRGTEGYFEAKALASHLEQRDPTHPQLPTLKGQIAAEAPRLSTPLSPGQEAALRREVARGGDLSAAARMKAKALTQRAGDAAAGAAEYPLKALSALLRPIDSPLPAAAKAGVEHGTGLSFDPRGVAGAAGPLAPLFGIRVTDPEKAGGMATAAAAAADPLGRFDAQGKGTGRWTNPPTTWNDVLEAMLRRWGKEKPAGVIGASSDPSAVGQKVTERELLGLGRTGTQIVGTAADIGLSPSTYLTAGAGAGRGVQIAGKTLIPDRAVSAIARFPGSAIEAGGEALAGKLAERGALEAAHRTSAVAHGIGKVAGPAQVLEGLPRVAGAIPLGGSKTLGELVGETFNRYHRINQVSDPKVRDRLLEIAQLRESATATQVAELTDEVERLMKGLPESEQRLVRDMIEDPKAFDWGTPAEPFHAPVRPTTAIEPAGAPRRPDVAPERPLPFGDEPAPYDALGWEEELADRMRRAEEEAADKGAMYGRESPQARAARARFEEARAAVSPDEPLGAADEIPGLPAGDEPLMGGPPRLPRSDEPPPRPAPRAPEGPPPDPLGEALPPGGVRAPSEREVTGKATTSGPGAMFGQPAAPTAAPGTPDAKRYGPIPEHLSGQVPTVSPQQAEVVARIENLLRKVEGELKGRGLIKGRPNYFPRERTRESLIQQKGADARVEKLGRGVNPRLDYRSGFQNAREEHGWINELIAKVNEQDARAAAAKGVPAPAPIPPVADTTSAVNTFWRRLPQRLQREIRGMGAEPERFLDRPKEALQRYLSRASKSVNDYDALQQVRAVKGEGGRPLARPFVREKPNGIVEEPYEVPVGGEYQIPKPGPGVRVETGRAPPGAPQLPRGKMGRKGEAMAGPPRRPIAGALPGEVPPGGAEAFQGKSPLDPLSSTRQREIPGYVYPKNQAWRQAFPNTALPRDVAAWIDAFGKPYWANEGFAGLVDQLIVRPLHKVQLPWKVAATSGAGPRFALRNYMSQQVFNLQAYGPATFAPRIQRESHLLGLPDEIFAANPALANRSVTAGGKTYTAAELRDVAKQTGLWRTLPEAETWSAVGGPFSDVWSGPARSSRAFGWSDPTAALSAGLGKIERGVQTATRAVGPVNPISKDFLLTKGPRVPEVGRAKKLGGARVGFHPLAEYGERQGRMAAFLLELDQGKDLVRAAQDAAKTHVNYQTFSPAFEKYGTLAYPFAKFAVGMAPNQAKWALQYPGRTMFTEHLLRGGEHMVPEEERQRYADEPRSELINEAGGRLVGFPGVEGGALKEPEAGRARGPARLPYVTIPPTADTMLNAFGAPVRIAGARDKSKAAASELLEDALPAVKLPYELATGRNVFTGEPIDMAASQPAPRAVQVLEAKYPELARRVFRAAWVPNPRTGEKYLATPTSVNLIWRYYPNVAAADLASAFLGGKRPYDNKTAIAFRLLGVTQLLHDPLIPATQEAREDADVGEQLRRLLLGWLPAKPGKGAPDRTP